MHAKLAKCLTPFSYSYKCPSDESSRTPLGTGSFGLLQRMGTDVPFPIPLCSAKVGCWILPSLWRASVIPAAGILPLSASFRHGTASFASSHSGLRSRAAHRAMTPVSQRCFPDAGLPVIANRNPSPLSRLTRSALSCLNGQEELAPRSAGRPC